MSKFQEERDWKKRERNVRDVNYNGNSEQKGGRKQDSNWSREREWHGDESSVKNFCQSNQFKGNRATKVQNHVCLNTGTVPNKPNRCRRNDKLEKLNEHLNVDHVDDNCAPEFWDDDSKISTKSNYTQNTKSEENIPHSTNHINGTISFHNLSLVELLCYTDSLIEHEQLHNYAFALKDRIVENILEFKKSERNELQFLCAIQDGSQTNKNEKLIATRMCFVLSKVYPDLKIPKFSNAHSNETKPHVFVQQHSDLISETEKLNRLPIDGEDVDKKVCHNTGVSNNTDKELKSNSNLNETWVCTNVVKENHKSIKTIEYNSDNNIIYANDFITVNDNKKSSNLNETGKCTDVITKNSENRNLSNIKSNKLNSDNGIKNMNDFHVDSNDGNKSKSSKIQEDTCNVKENLAKNMPLYIKTIESTCNGTASAYENVYSRFTLGNLLNYNIDAMRGKTLFSYAYALKERILENIKRFSYPDNEELEFLCELTDGTQKENNQKLIAFRMFEVIVDYEFLKNWEDPFAMHFRCTQSRKPNLPLMERRK